MAAVSSSGTTIPLHDWATCSSPVTSTLVSTAGSADGAYLFQVRAAGKLCKYTPSSVRVPLLGVSIPQLESCRKPVCNQVLHQDML